MEIQKDVDARIRTLIKFIDEHMDVSWDGMIDDEIYSIVCAWDISGALAVEMVESAIKRYAGVTF